MVKVFFTVDTEIWLDGWSDLNRKFPEFFRRYVYGPTKDGDLGLPFQLKAMGDYGVKGVFFVEPLFSLRFGLQPLAEITGMIESAGQEVQLHMHTEWVNEADPELLMNLESQPDIPSERRACMRDFSLEEQVLLISLGRDILHRAGVEEISAFRAGSFGMNPDTLKALETVGIPFDLSYNHTHAGPGVAENFPGVRHLPFQYGNLWELPMSLIEVADGRYRHLQVGACSFEEIRSALYSASENGWEAVVLLFHNFELLDSKTKTKPDRVVVNRFLKLMKFLDRHRDLFQTCGFKKALSFGSEEQPPPPRVNPLATGKRLAEQVWRKFS